MSRPTDDLHAAIDTALEGLRSIAEKLNQKLAEAPAGPAAERALTGRCPQRWPDGEYQCVHTAGHPGECSFARVEEEVFTRPSYTLMDEAAQLRHVLDPHIKEMSDRLFAALAAVGVSHKLTMREIQAAARKLAYPDVDTE